MISVAPDVDVVVFILPPLAVVLIALLAPLVVRQARWQRDDEDEDPPGFTSDPGD